MAFQTVNSGMNSTKSRYDKVLNEVNLSLCFHVVCFQLFVYFNKNQW
jgi:hypothetical protein